MSAQFHFHDPAAAPAITDLRLCILQSLLLAPTPAGRADSIAADAGLCGSLFEQLSVSNLPRPRLQRLALIESLSPLQFECWLQAEILRALSGAGTPSVAGSAWRRQSLLRAHCAQRLAQAAGYPDSEEAYLCGLMLEAAGPALPGELASSQADRHLAMLQTWKLPLPAQDAQRYRHLPLAELQGVHRLTLILRLAQQLSAGSAENLGAELDALCRAARDDTERLEREFATTATAPQQVLVDEAHRLWSQAATGAPSGSERVRASWQAWFGAHPLLLLRHDLARGVLCAAGPDSAGTEWPLSSADRSSVVARTLDDQRIQRFPPAAGAGLPAALADEQMARALGCSGFLCLPLHAAGVQGVMLIGADPATQAVLLARGDALLRYARSAAPLLAPPSSPPEPVAAPPPRVREVLHEAAAPLTTLRNYLHVLQQRQPGDELRIMREELERLSQILLQLKESGAAQLRAASDINRLVQDVLHSLRLNWPAPRHVIDSELDPRLRQLMLDGGALKQILINLAHNAIEAMPQGGHLHLLTRGQVNVDGIDSVLIELSDDGPGIPAAVHERLFLPKTSAKPGHSGLGLSIAHRLVRELGGSISCISGPGGTRFQILLPRLSPSPES